MYHILKTIKGKIGRRINNTRYETPRDAEIELMSELQNLCDDKGISLDSEYESLSPLLRDLQDELQKSKEGNFKSFKYDDYKIEIVKS